MSKKLLYSLLVIILISCSSENEENKNLPLRENIFNPLYLTNLFETPNSFGSPWINTAIKKLDVNNISIVMKGGFRPDNILEKFIYDFDKNGNNDTFSYYFYNFATDVVNLSYMNFENNKLKKIDVIKYYKIGNQPPVYAYHDTKRSFLIKPKANKKDDTLFFYPSIQNPSLILDKIGRFNNYIEIIIPKGSSSSVIIDEVNKIDSNLMHFELTEKLVTYTENGLPVESYHIGDNWNQLELAKKWEYNKYKQPISFKQWIHGNITKDIEIMYNENALPKRISFNRKKYYLYYKKK